MRLNSCRKLAIAAGTLAITGACAGAAWSSSSALPAPLPVVDPTVAPNRAVEPVVLTGADFPGLAVPENATAKAPFTDLLSCDPLGNLDTCNHNEYSPPQLDTSGVQNQLPVKGIHPDQLLGYNWDAKHHKFVQIPFQVDKV